MLSNQRQHTIIGLLFLFFTSGLASDSSERFSIEINRIDPPRLFTIPIAHVLGANDIKLFGGGAYGATGSESWQGTIGIGLGNIAEVELSTVNLANNITSGSAMVPTSAFKLLLLSKENFTSRIKPALAMGLRSTSNWRTMESHPEVVRANQDWTSKGIHDIDYQTRFTMAYGISSLYFRHFALHTGLSLTDIRTKKLTINNYCWPEYGQGYAEQQHNQYGGFVGLEINRTPTTKIMLELSTTPHYAYITDSLGTDPSSTPRVAGRVDISREYLVIAGIRQFFTDWLSVDTGVYYLGNYKGIADTQIKLEFNLFIPGEIYRNIPTIFRKRTGNSPGRNNFEK